MFELLKKIMLSRRIPFVAIPPAEFEVYFIDQYTRRSEIFISSWN